MSVNGSDIFTQPENMNLLDNIVDRDVKNAFVQCVDINSGACQSTTQCHIGSVDEVQTFTAEARMRFVFDNEDNVSCTRRDTHKQKRLQTYTDSKKHAAQQETYRTCATH